MRPRVLVREAVLDVLTGTARAVLLAVVSCAVAVGAQWADLSAIRSLSARVSEFRASGADVLVLSAPGQVDGALCELLTAQPGVSAAGAVRKTTDSYALNLPGSSVPTYQVTPAMPTVLASVPELESVTDGTAPGVVVSAEVAGALGVGVGDRIRTTDGSTAVAGVYGYPQDGRTSGMGYAMLVPTSSRGAFDACWVRQWPIQTSVEQLVRGVLIPGTSDPDLPAPDVGQLNTSLGRNLDAATEYAQRTTRWSPLAALIAATALGAGSIRLRKLELASARHLGVDRWDQVLVHSITAVLWAAPAALAALVAGAVLIAGAAASDAPSLIAGATLTPVAVLIGAVLGAGTTTAAIREGDLMRYLKER